MYKPKAHKYDQDISYEAVQKLGEYVAALPREETYVEEMGAPSQAATGCRRRRCPRRQRHRRGQHHHGGDWF